jgi:hypothetical protein
LTIELEDEVKVHEPASSVRLSFADDVEAQDMQVEVVALRGTEPWASGKGTIKIVPGETTGAEIVLKRLQCGDWCEEGATACSEDGVMTCERGSDSCLQWSAPVACSGETPYCSLGECSASCVDECAAGESECVGPSKVRLCGQADSDECLDWQMPQDCMGEDECSAGVCTDQPVDECTEGEVKCIGNGVATCGDLDQNGIFEWGPPTPCTAGSTCSSGECSADCVDECQLSLCQNLLYRECGNFDSDSCTELSPGTNCTSGQPCMQGSCSVDAGCELSQVTCDDPPASFCVDGTTLRTYSPAGSCNATGDCDYSYTDESCDDCQNGVCNNIVQCTGTCTPETLAIRGVEVMGIAVDATHVYWTEPDDDRIMRMPKSGGTPVEIAMGDDPRYVVVDGSHLYWSQRPNLYGSVYRVPKAGGTAVKVFDAGYYPHRLAIDSTHVYLIKSDAIVRAPKGGGAMEVVIATSGVAPDLALDDSRVYYADYGKIYAVDKDGSNQTILASAQGNIKGIALDATHIYWTTYNTNGIMRASKNLSTPLGLANNAYRPLGIAATADHVFWTSSEADEVGRAAKNGSASSIIGSSQADAFEIVSDGSYVYWTNRAGGQIMRSCACGGP